MGRSTTSCFKIISCGGGDESLDTDDIVHASPQKKGSDKRGWSFRKKSPRHRVLSNTIVTEVPSSGKKEGSEPVTISSEPQVIPSISEKTPDNIWTETETETEEIEIPRLSNSVANDTTVSNTASEAACEDDNKSESVPDESSILVIQAAVRRFLGSIFVVGCNFQAQRQLVKRKNIVKLQAAVRGHLVRNHAVGTLRCVQAIVKMQALVRARRANTHAETSSVEEKPTLVSIEKLLSNRLARQLMESTPKTKQINIKCDPSKSDSAWNWLERWMSVSAPVPVEPHAPDHDHDNVSNTENPVETRIPLNLESTDINSEDAEATVPSERKIDVEESSYERKAEEEKPDSPPDEPTNLKSEAEIEVISIPENPVLETEPKHPTKPLATDQTDSDGRKSAFGSRKASNPAFIAAQSKFEELTSKINPLKSVPSSECGTELSITSTLDSPDQNDVRNKKLEEEAEVVNEAEDFEMERPKSIAVSEADIELDPESGNQVCESNADIKLEIEHETIPILQASPEASPRSHVTVPESQGTPSSHVSNTKKAKSDKKASTLSQKRKSWSGSNKSPDSGLRNSLEQLPKEPKSGKRRNSFGSPRSEHTDQEPNSSGNSSLPSYMQATESARLKAIANSSPRSSPDTQDKETHRKKRHSLPSAVNGRQDSPRIQRSTSQALQATKGNGSQERKWQR